jgi:hypothetical protein
MPRTSVSPPLSPRSAPDVTASLASPRPGVRRRPGYQHRRRLLAAILLLVGFGLTAVALETPWWSDTASMSGITLRFSFYPGATFAASCSGASVSGVSSCGDVSSVDETYASAGLWTVGALYAAVQWLLAAAVVLAVTAAVMGFLGAFGLNFGRMQLTLTGVLTLGALILLLTAPLWTMVAQPAALVADQATLTQGAAGGGTVAGTFWGSNTTAGRNETWGPNVGWYIGFSGAGPLLVALVLLLGSRRDPYTTRELGAVRGGPPGETERSSAGTVDDYAAESPVPSAPPTGTACPSCRSDNPSGVWVCWKCQRPLR